MPKLVFNYSKESYFTDIINDLNGIKTSIKNCYDKINEAEGSEELKDSYGKFDYNRWC
jgi:hypothetical protein